jgi:hypothetical protein
MRCKGAKSSLAPREPLRGSFDRVSRAQPHLPGMPLTVHFVAQHFTSGGLQALSAQVTAQVAPPQPTSLHASLPVQLTVVWPAVPWMEPHD